MQVRAVAGDVGTEAEATLTGSFGPAWGYVSARALPQFASRST